MPATGGYSSWHCYCSCFSSSFCSSLFLIFLFILFLFLSSCSSHPCPQALHCVLYLGFLYNLSPFLMACLFFFIAWVIILSICLVANLYRFLNKLLVLHDLGVSSIPKRHCHDKAETSSREQEDFTACKLTHWHTTFYNTWRTYIYIYIYIYMERPFLMFLDHTQRRSKFGRTPLDE